MDDLSLIYSIDSAAEVSETFDEFVIGDDIKSDVIPECIHIWRTDYVKNNEVCIKCGVTKELETFEDNRNEINESISIEPNLINVKGINLKMKRFYLWHEGQNYIAKSFNEDLSVIKGIGDKLGINRMVIDDAKLIYKRYKEITGLKNNYKYLSKASTKKERINTMIKFKDKDDEFKKQILFSNCKLRGDSKTGLLCGCIYYACLKNGFCIISNVLADKANIKPKYVHKGCNVLLQIRDLNDDRLNILMPVICFPYPVDYLKTVCDGFEELIEMKIDDKAREQIKICLLNTQYYDLIVNHNPHSFAIGIVLLYLVSNQIISFRFSKKEIANHFGICQPTINTTYKELINNKDKVFDYSHNEEQLIRMIKDKEIKIDNKRFNEFFSGISENANKIDLEVIKKLSIY